MSSTIPSEETEVMNIPSAADAAAGAAALLDKLSLEAQEAGEIIEEEEAECTVFATEADLRAVQIDEWYPRLKDVTFKTALIPLPSEFVSYLTSDGVILPESMQHIYAVDHISDDEDTHSLPESSSDKDEEEDKEEEVPSFPELEQAIESAIQDFGGAVFPKVNWSAPLDALWMNTGTAKCQRVADIFLLLKSSDRIIYDLTGEIFEQVPQPLNGVKGPNTPMLVLRKWANLNPAQEFRVFVRDGELFAISQRECTTYFEFLGAQMDRYEDVLLEFHEETLQPALELKNYVFDVYIDLKKRVWLVDIGAWGSPTCPRLFDWNFLQTSPMPDPSKGPYVRIVNSEAERFNSAAALSRGPVDVHMAQDFHRFMDIVREQNAPGYESD